MRPALAVAWGVFLVALVALVAQGNPWGLTILFGEGALLTIGTLLVVRRPGNVIGTVLIVMGALWSLILAADATVATLADRGHDTIAGWLALLFMITTIPLLWLGNIVIWLVFPDGRPTTPGTSRFLRISAAYTTVLTVVHVFARPRILAPGEAEYPHPFVDQTVADRVGTVMDVLVAVFLFVGGLVAAGMLFARSRRSNATERRQIAWVALGFVVSTVLLLVNGFVQPLGDAAETQADLLFDSIAFLALAVTLGIAIMKYRLYDLDVIVSRSVMYLGLLFAITAVYATVVVIPALAIGALDDGGPGLMLPIVATAMVALLFEPIRSRMEQWAGRLVYGNRATPHEVLSKVTSQLVDTEGRSTDDLARIVAEGTGADRAVVWLDDDGQLDEVGSWSRAEAAPSEASAAEEHTFAVDVRHEDERLGVISIAKPRNDAITSADRELLGDVAGGAGLALRNIRLTKELEDRVAEIRDSRRRLIEAHDRERHRLERDLHDGAQQQVVALKVKLGIAKKLAEREGADAIADGIVGLADDTQDAVDALRQVAHGIYPALLESDGLEPALRAVERTSALPIELVAADLGRYERSTEETAYFCVTETLQVARMAGAPRARVDLVGRNGDLVTEIDLGRLETELDLRAVEDRLDAAGGSLTIDDEPGRGCSVVSTLPIAGGGVRQ